VLRTQHGLRLLGPSDLPETLELLARDPVVNVFADYRARLTRLDPRWLGGEMWGYAEDGRLLSVCHAAANLVPVDATPEAVEAFAGRAISQGRRCSTIVGPADAVAGLWSHLAPHWSPPRELRWNQPHLEITTEPTLPPDPLVRRTRPEELDVVYPSCVAMYTEEVGVSPENDAGGGDLYRARIRQLIGRGWSMASFDDAGVVFKAEVACATPYAAQVQGVWVRPDRRGEGLAVSGMASVVSHVLGTGVAPVVSLYVNEWNEPARAAYARVGFEQTATFATMMF
jgi:uncharacterized protein